MTPETAMGKANVTLSRLMANEPLALTTGGDGFWSDVKDRRVRVRRLEVVYVDEELSFASLDAYFDAEDWDTQHDGLIYTDRRFLEGLNTFLVVHGLPEIEYSEQGLQGDGTVNFDCGPEFIRKLLETSGSA